MSQSKILFISLPSHQCLTNVSSKLNTKLPTATHKPRGEAEGRLQGLQILLQGLRAALPWGRQGCTGASALGGPCQAKWSQARKNLRHRKLSLSLVARSDTDSASGSAQRWRGLSMTLDSYRHWPSKRGNWLQLHLLML